MSRNHEWQQLQRGRPGTFGQGTRFDAVSLVTYDEDLTGRFAPHFVPGQRVISVRGIQCAYRQPGL